MNILFRIVGDEVTIESIQSKSLSLTDMEAAEKLKDALDNTLVRQLLRIGDGQFGCSADYIGGRFDLCQCKFYKDGSGTGDARPNLVIMYGNVKEAKFVPEHILVPEPFRSW